MKRILSLLLLLSMLCGLFAGCGNDAQTGTIPGGQTKQKEKIIINACDYVYLSKSGEDTWFPGYHKDALKSALLPYVKQTISSQELQNDMDAFSVEQDYLRVSGETAEVHMVVRDHLLKGLEEIADVEFIWEDTVVVALDPGTGSTGPQGLQPVKLLDYFVFEPYGYNGSAEMRAYFDSARFANDYGSRAAGAMFSEDNTRFASPEGYVSIHFGGYRPGIHYSRKESLKNGDNITVSIDAYTMVDLGLEIQTQTMEYTVRDLADFAPVDPFENVTVFSRGVEDRTYAGNHTVIKDKGEYTILCLDSELDSSSPIHQGDVVHFSVPDWAKRSYGEDFFTRTEADIPVTLSTLPTQENAHTVVNCTDKIQLDKLRKIDTGKNEKSELLGLMLYYNDPGHKSETGKNSFNQLICVYKCTNEAMPQGWYTYTAHRNNIMLNKGFHLVTERTEPLLVDDTQTFLLVVDRDRGDYAQNYPTSFTENGVEYQGYPSISQALEAMEANLIGSNRYDHLAVSDSLKSQIQEF